MPISVPFLLHQYDFYPKANKCLVFGLFSVRIFTIFDNKTLIKPIPTYVYGIS